MALRKTIKEFVNGWTKATKEQFTGHPIANLFRQDFKDEIEKLVTQLEKTFKVKASVGAGNWANVPWLSILNPKITSTTQDGVYPVYLFRADGSGFYLSLNQGTTEPTRTLGKKRAEERAEKIKKIILERLPQLSNWGISEINLRAETTLGKSYEMPNIVAKYYDSSDIPSDETLTDDLKTLLNFYKEIEVLDMENLLESNSEIDNPVPKRSKLVNAVSLPKPFLLLAGISGTGKTRFVRKQAEAHQQFKETYCLTSVRPDWHEPSDLLGYISRLNGQPEYITTDVLQFIAKAWRAILDAGLSVKVLKLAEQNECLVVTGEHDALNAVLPYWLCLDEMNLAPVEQYFADYLSVIETREWRWDEGVFFYSCDPLLKPATIEQVADNHQLRGSLGFGDAKYSDAWALFCQHGLGVPLNLIVAGTVNMDETTHSFSRKVIDRALSFDFGEFFPNDYSQFFSPSTRSKVLSYPIWSQACLEDLGTTIDAQGKESVGFLEEVNEVLANSPFRLAYRALNELLLAVISQNPQDALTLKAVWDDFLMCKVLPRIEGDHDKLGNAPSILENLSSLLESKFSDFWDKESNDLGARPDLFREGVEDDDKVIRIACRSKAKLAWMQARLSTAGFTSFWP